MKEIAVKICGMREASNIREVIELKPDWLGLIFYPGSKRYVKKPSLLNPIIDQHPDIKWTGVFVNPDLNMIDEIIRRIAITSIQLHGKESPSFCSELKMKGLQIMKAFGVSDEFDFSLTDQYEGLADYFLFDTRTADYGGSGLAFNHSLLTSYKGKTPFLLSGGIGPETESIPDHPKLAGVDLNSRFELSAGVKDARLLESFIQKIRN